MPFSSQQIDTMISKVDMDYERLWSRLYHIVICIAYDYLDVTVVRFCVCYLGIYVLVRHGELGMSKITAKRSLIE
jgi:hypothetical protein